MCVVVGTVCETKFGNQIQEGKLGFTLFSSSLSFFITGLTLHDIMSHSYITVELVFIRVLEDMKGTECRR